MDYASLHGGTRIFQVAVLILTMQCLYKAIIMSVFTSQISWKSMRAVDEKQDIKLL